MLVKDDDYFDLLSKINGNLFFKIKFIFFMYDNAKNE